MMLRCPTRPMPDWTARVALHHAPGPVQEHYSPTQSWHGSHVQFDDGRCDGFVRSDAGPRGFDRYGFRVPAVIVSPYARPGEPGSRTATSGAPTARRPALAGRPGTGHIHAPLTVDIMSRLLQHRSLTANIVHLPSWRTGARMLPTQRRQAIITQVREQAAVSAEDLSGQFAVSVETIRRDLRALRDAGLLERVYGGATCPSGRSSEGSFAARS